MVNAGSTFVRVEIAAETLSRLLVDGHVCAADLHCLDGHSKQCLWRLCLRSCRGCPMSAGKEKGAGNDVCLAHRCSPQNLKPNHTIGIKRS